MIGQLHLQINFSDINEIGTNECTKGQWRGKTENISVISETLKGEIERKYFPLTVKFF